MNYLFTAYLDFIQGQSTSSKSRIPTALLMASVNSPDHLALLGHLKSQIHQKGGHVAIVGPNSDVSSAPHIFSTISEQILSGDEKSASFLLVNLPLSFHLSSIICILVRGIQLFHVEHCSSASPIIPILSFRLVSRRRKCPFWLYFIINHLLSSA